MSGKWVTILKGKDTKQYLPIYMGTSQANIIKGELIYGRFSEPEMYEHFLAGNDIAGYYLESVIIEEINGILRAKLVLTEGGNSFKIECPVAGAIALGFRRNASILVGESSFYEAHIATY